MRFSQIITTVDFDQAAKVIEELQDVVQKDNESGTFYQGRHPTLGETIIILGAMGPYLQITLSLIQ